MSGSRMESDGRMRGVSVCFKALSFCLTGRRPEVTQVTRSGRPKHSLPAAQADPRIAISAAMRHSADSAFNRLSAHRPCLPIPPMKFASLLCLIACLSPNVALHAQTLEQQLKQEAPASLAAEARQSGDAKRGAILFHQVHIGCVKCHAVDGSRNALGPDLPSLGKQIDATDAHVVTSILQPSANIRKNFEPITVVTSDGKTQTGLLVSQTDQQIILRDPTRNGQRITLESEVIEDVVRGSVSVMPAGLVNQLTGRAQFLDLVRYVLEIRDGGLKAAQSLQPPPGLITLRLPDYEAKVDHAGLIRSLDDEAFERGQKIYERLCINCHGDLQKPGSLPTALRFGEGKFRHGSDPHAMYRTLTHGFGLMVPQTWMVPRQKYDVIHYIREHYVRPHNAAMYAAISDDYLRSLPPGDSFGPEPVEYAPWSDMDYGPTVVNTFEIGSDGENFAYKGIASRLDPGPGGVSKGHVWSVFDHDTMRLAAAWTRSHNADDPVFINWEGIHFDGRHNRHPRIVGDVQLQNPSGPGWANPETDRFEDDQRVVGRDGRRYGPLPADWAKYRGLHVAGDRSIIDYTVADTRILECPEHLTIPAENQSADVFVRQLEVQARRQKLTALIATLPEGIQATARGSQAVVVRPAGRDVQAQQTQSFSFDGSRFVQVDAPEVQPLFDDEFTVSARIRTTQDGTIWCRTQPGPKWVPNGTTLFVRNGRVCYDIGWVGVVAGRHKVDDGQWHQIALTWKKADGEVSIYVDGKVSARGNLKPKQSLQDSVVRIGYTAPNFPSQSAFSGDISFVGTFDRQLNADQVRQIDSAQSAEQLGATDLWQFEGSESTNVANQRRPATIASWKNLEAASESSVEPKVLLAGLIGASDGFELQQRSSRLCLQVPPGGTTEALSVWTARLPASVTDQQIDALISDIQDRLQPESLSAVIARPPAARWTGVLKTPVVTMQKDGPFAVDLLTPPRNNPWFARLRLTGHDFFSDPDRMAVCSWDGDVWLVSGLQSLQSSNAQLSWQRIASGLFQPLGLKIVGEDIYLTCRDQLVVLRDKDGDGETDFYECFNNDHQVTDHFHEFAMGLQRDDDGNFYYAKSARHALKAVVPHHGTLLKVPADGSRTEILATGFRAANGVCLNPDGSFIVTDQEGHWNPKNRINWVREGGFYGNMFGHHDVTDSSDEAMEQPLCWITNDFDRSPAELLWVNDSAWGPLDGSLLNLSYGYGKVFVVPHEQVNGQMQGGMCELPIDQFPTGIVRGRISPHDHGLYLTGMFAWGSSRNAQEGGLYRLRPTGQPMWLPLKLNAVVDGIRIEFSDPVDVDSASETNRYEVKVWQLKRTANYGSKHYNERILPVTAAKVSADGRTVELTIPDLAPTWGMEIRCQLPVNDGESVERVIHNTVHELK